MCNTMMCSDAAGCHRSESHCRNKQPDSKALRIIDIKRFVSCDTKRKVRSGSCIPVRSPSSYACSGRFRSVLVSALTSVACRLQKQGGNSPDNRHACGAVQRCGRKTTCISQAFQLQVSSCDFESAHAQTAALRLQTAVDGPQATARLAAPMLQHRIAGASSCPIRQQAGERLVRPVAGSRYQT